MKRDEGATLSLSEFCNQLIRSWVWMLSADAETGRFDGIYVSSGRARKQHIYFVPADTLVTVFRTVGLDDVVVLRIKMDSNGAGTSPRQVARTRQIRPTTGERPSRPASRARRLRCCCILLLWIKARRMRLRRSTPRPLSVSF